MFDGNKIIPKSKGMGNIGIRFLLIIYCMFPENYNFHICKLLFLKERILRV